MLFPLTVQPFQNNSTIKKVSSKSNTSLPIFYDTDCGNTILPNLMSSKVFLTNNNLTYNFREFKDVINLC